MQGSGHCDFRFQVFAPDRNVGDVPVPHTHIARCRSETERSERHVSLGHDEPRPKR
jgi:hypothetical protein